MDTCKELLTKFMSTFTKFEMLKKVVGLPVSKKMLASNNSKATANLKTLTSPVHYFLARCIMSAAKSIKPKVV